MTKLCRLWGGELSLPDTFWNWAVIGGLAVNFVTSALFLVLISMDRPLLAYFAGYAPSVPYNILVTVGVWRSAGRHSGDRLWVEPARIGTLITMVLLTIT